MDASSPSSDRDAEHTVRRSKRRNSTAAQSLAAITALTLLASCANVSPERSQSASRVLVGEWRWMQGPDDCPISMTIAFRSDGTYSRSSESCDLASDSFTFDYGWYVAKSHLCFVHVPDEEGGKRTPRGTQRRRFLSMFKEGYVAERCEWRLKNISKDAIEIVTNDNPAVEFTMTRAPKCGALAEVLGKCY